MMWPGGARGTPGKAWESSPKRGNAVQCVSERRRKALMSRKCGSTCTEGVAVCRASTEYSARCEVCAESVGKCESTARSARLCRA